MKKSSILVAACLSSCIPSMYITEGSKPVKQCVPLLFAISNETPEKFHQPIIDAFNYWEKAAGIDIFVYAGVVPYTIDSIYIGGLLGVGVVPELKPSYKSTGTVCGRTYMTYDHYNCIAKVKIKLSIECSGDPDEFQTIVRHEVGHTLGLRDSADFTSLMSAKLKATMQHPVDATEEEIKAIKALYGRNNEAQNYR